jgi:hypothetical protein
MFGDVRPVAPFMGVPADLQGFDQWVSHHDAVITNPPFSLAGEVIDHFLPRCDWLILLLRSSFKLGKYRDNMPDEYRLPQRPEFVASEKCNGDPNAYIPQDRKPCSWNQKLPMSAAPSRKCPECGGRVQRSTTDASEYSWFVWTPERGRRFGRISVLPDTPLSERVEDRGRQ